MDNKERMEAELETILKSLGKLNKDELSGAIRGEQLGQLMERIFAETDGQESFLDYLIRYTIKHKWHGAMVIMPCEKGEEHGDPLVVGFGEMESVDLSGSLLAIGAMYLGALPPQALLPDRPTAEENGT